MPQPAGLSAFKHDRVAAVKARGKKHLATSSCWLQPVVEFDVLKMLGIDHDLSISEQRCNAEASHEPMNHKKKTGVKGDNKTICQIMRLVIDGCSESIGFTERVCEQLFTEGGAHPFQSYPVAVSPDAHVYHKQLVLCLSRLRRQTCQLRST